MTFLTSVIGVLFCSILPAAGGISASPDWALGFLFGIGGFGGRYARARRHNLSPKHIRVMFGPLIVTLVIRYINLLRDKVVVRKS